MGPSQWGRERVGKRDQNMPVDSFGDKCNGERVEFLLRAKGDLRVINKVAFSDGIYRQIMLFQKM